jgi:16S rRNA processing protein RimM
MPDKDKLVLIGKVAATHGIRGYLRVVPYSGEADSICTKSHIVLLGPNGELDTVEISSSVVHGRKVLITLKSFSDINQVKHFVGREIYVTREQLPDLAEGEYYWCDLIGLRVMTTLGECLGELSDIISTGSNDVYMVRSGEKEYLLPALDDVIMDVNLDSGIMVVNPPEGLLEL